MSVANDKELQTFNTGAESDSTEGPSAKWRQIYYAGSAHIGAFIMATVWSWSSTALPSLRESHEEIGEVTASHEAWIASITFMAGAMGSFVMGFIADKAGLKASLVIATVPLLLGWLLVTFAQNMAMILIGRFITGFFVAGVGVSGNLVAEYSHPKRRGRLNFLFDMLFCVGVLYIYIIGTFAAWRIQAGLCALLCVIFFIVLWTINESPRVLIKKGKKDQAKKALKFMRDSKNVDHEVTVIERDLESEGTRRDARSAAQGGGWKAKCMKHMNKETMKPIFISICLQFFLQVCGVVPIVCYAVDVFKAAGTAQFNEYTSTIVLGAINLAATIVAYFFVDKYGRRKLMMFSEAFLTLTLFSIGLFLYLKHIGLSLDKYDGFLLACFVVFITTYSFGVGPLPWVVMGEIIAPAAKGFSNGAIILCFFKFPAARIFGFLVMFYFRDMNLYLGQHGVYWFFAAVCLSGFIFTFFFLPETKGRKLDEIQSDLKRGWIQRGNTSEEADNPRTA